MEEGLYDKRKIPDDGWFFLKTVLIARDDEELRSKKNACAGSISEAGGVDVPEIAEKAMGAKAQEYRPARLAGLAYYGPGRLVRHRSCVTPECSP